MREHYASLYVFHSEFRESRESSGKLGKTRESSGKSISGGNSWVIPKGPGSSHSDPKSKNRKYCQQSGNYGTEGAPAASTVVVPSHGAQRHAPARRGRGVRPLCPPPTPRPLFRVTLSLRVSAAECLFIPGVNSSPLRRKRVTTS